MAFHKTMFIWHDGGCNQENTVTFLQQLAQWLTPQTSPVILIWNGAPWHKAKSVQQAAANLGITLKPLPAF